MRKNPTKDIARDTVPLHPTVYCNIIINIIIDRKSNDREIIY